MPASDRLCAFQLPSGLYKKVLVVLHDSVLPHMSEPTLMMDFLTAAYEVGEWRTSTCTLETQQEVGCMSLVTCSLSQGHMIISKHVLVCGRGLEPMTSSGTHTDDLLMKVLPRQHT